MSNKILDTIAKRKATILKKRENKELKKEQNLKKRTKLQDDKYSVYQTKYINEEDKPTITKVLSYIKGFKQAIQLKVGYKGNKNSSIEINVENIKSTRKQIKEQLEKVRKYYFKNNIDVEFETVLSYNSGWKPSHITQVDESIELYDPIDYFKDNTQYNKSFQEAVSKQKIFTAYQLYIIKKPKVVTTMGFSNDKNNNCVFHCLKIALGDKLPWTLPHELKQYLKLKYDEPIPIELIPNIERKLKNVAINIFGENKYISSVASNKVINLKLKDGHCTIKNDAFSTNLKKHVSFTEKQLLLYNKKTFECFDGTDDVRELSKDELIDIYNNKSKYVIVNKNVDDTCFEEEYDNLIKKANKLKVSSNGIINLYKTGNFNTTALNLFDSFTKLYHPEHIDQLESEYVDGAFTGGLISSTKYNGELHDYDIISCFPSIYLSNLLIPIKRGIFQTISNDEFQSKEFLANGIYHCIIEPSTNANINKLFRYNKKNYYTHICVKRARELNLNIQMIEGKTNFLYYPSNYCVKASELFKQFTDIVYKLKEQKINGSKEILNILWGSLSEKKKTKHYVKYSDEFDIPDECNLKNIKRINDDTYCLTVTNSNQIFKHNWGRLCCFMTSYARNKLSQIMQPHIDSICFVHTDGFLSKKKLDIDTSDEIGCLKYKGFNAWGYVNSCNERTTKFTL